MQQYFQVSPPSVHQMVLTLVARGLIERTPGQARCIRLLTNSAQRATGLGLEGKSGGVARQNLSQTKDGAVLGKVDANTISASIQHEDSGGHEPECTWSAHI